MSDSGALLKPSWADQFGPEAEWRSLDEVCSAVIDCPHSTPEVDPAGPCVMARTPDVLSGVLRLDDAQRVSWETFRERTSRGVPQLGDLLYSREGTYFGVAAEVPDGVPVCLGQRMVQLRPDPTLVTPRYLRIYLNSPLMQRHIKGFHDGSVAQRLNVSTIRSLPVAVLPRASQERIAAVLGVMDDKIELNRRTNRTLEALAESLFRSWFVDFDPVVAKVDGRQPFGMNAETAVLFPDAFVDSDLGPIPEGWEVSTIGEDPEVVGGTTPRTKNPDYWEGGDFHWATPKDLSGLDIPLLLDTSRKITKAGLDQISSGLLPVGTVLMSSRAPIGYTAIAGVPMAVNQGFVAMVPRGRLGSRYLLFWTRDAMHEIESRAGGTTFAEISKKNFRPIPVLVPAPQVLEVFENRAGEWLELIRLNAEQNSILAALRDLLLPKLFSGEVRVEEAEELVKTA